MASIPTLRPSGPTIFASSRALPAYESEFFAIGNLATLPEQLLATGLKWIWESWRPYDRDVEYDNPALPSERQLTLLAPETADRFIADIRERDVQGHGRMLLLIGLDPAATLEFSDPRSVQRAMRRLLSRHSTPIELIVSQSSERPKQRVYAPDRPDPRLSKLLARWGIVPGSEQIARPYYELGVAALEEQFGLPMRRITHPRNLLNWSLWLLITLTYFRAFAFMKDESIWHVSATLAALTLIVGIANLRYRRIRAGFLWTVEVLFGAFMTVSSVWFAFASAADAMPDRRVGSPILFALMFIFAFSLALFYLGLLLEGLRSSRLFWRLQGKAGKQRLLADLEKEDKMYRAKEALLTLRDPDTIEPLLTKLESRNVSVRMNAVTVLGAIKDERVYTPVLRMLSDRDYVVRQAAAEALGQQGDVRALSALRECLQHGDPFILDASHLHQGLENAIKSIERANAKRL